MCPHWISYILTDLDHALNPSKKTYSFAPEKSHISMQQNPLQKSQAISASSVPCVFFRHFELRKSTPEDVFCPRLKLPVFFPRCFPPQPFQPFSASRNELRCGWLRGPPGAPGTPNLRRRVLWIYGDFSWDSLEKQGGLIIDFNGISSGWWAGATPLKNMSSSIGMMKFPVYGKNWKMFQTTNQAWILQMFQVKNW